VRDHFTAQGARASNCLRIVDDGDPYRADLTYRPAPPAASISPPPLTSASVTPPPPTGGAGAAPFSTEEACQFAAAAATPVPPMAGRGPPAVQGAASAAPHFDAATVLPSLRGAPAEELDESDFFFGAEAAKAVRDAADEAAADAARAAAMRAMDVLYDEVDLGGCGPMWKESRVVLLCQLRFFALMYSFFLSFWLRDCDCAGPRSGSQSPE